MDKQVNKIWGIQGIRGIACLMVFFSHAFGAFGFEFNPWISFLYDGSIAVVFFYTLSGYFQYESCKEFTIKGYFNYLSHKVIKIWPPYLITLIVGAILCNMRLNSSLGCFSEWFSDFWKVPVNFKDLIMQIPIIGKYDATLINPPIWTLYAEVQGIILMPILDCFYRKHRNKWIIVIALIVSVMFNVLNCFPQIAWKWLGVFIIGYLGSVLGRRGKYEKTNDILNYYTIPILWLVFNILCFRVRYYMPENIKEYLFSSLAVIWLGFACNTNVIKKICSINLLVKLGNISYEFYLVHFIVLLAFRPLGNNLMPLAYIGISLAVSLVAAAFLSKIIGGFVNEKLRRYI